MSTTTAPAVSEILASLAPALAAYTRANRDLTEQQLGAGNSGEAAHKYYEARDDAALAVADWCIDLVAALEHQPAPEPTTTEPGLGSVCPHCNHAWEDHDATIGCWAPGDTACTCTNTYLAMEGTRG